MENTFFFSAKTLFLFVVQEKRFKDMISPPLSLSLSFSLSLSLSLPPLSLLLSLSLCRFIRKET